ncbi:MAG: hypothetical protein J6386_08050 [Candidatus Synoicihabitans palmerolidicus]|nr:hypothetical protein [Candidatus Synoicihabitans palmerolidicus]
MIGTNNTGYESGTKTPRNSVPETAEGVKAVIDAVRDKLPNTKILLLGIFFPAENPPNFQRVQVQQINAAIATFHDGEHVWFLDISPRFLNADGTLSKSIMPDFLHPNETGYQIWADAIDGKLKPLLE